MNQKTLFFRNDDLGCMPQQFERMAALFREHQVKICLAAIPLYCNDSYKRGALSADREIFEIHTHGYSHIDHQSFGKKSEYGSQRATESVFYELKKSQEMIRELFGDLYFEAFTPPWNRMDDVFLPLLKDAGFSVLSRDGQPRSNIDGVTEINVNVDVHTSKSGRLDTTARIWSEVERVWTLHDTCGLMLHHKHMVEDDFQVLTQLLREIRERQIRTVNFRDLASEKREIS